MNLAGVASVGAIVATVNSVVWPFLLCRCDSTTARVVNAKVNLIFNRWHVRASSRCIVNLMVSVGLWVAIDNESSHFHSPLID